MQMIVATEKKFRDSQSGYTKSQQALKESGAENKVLLDKLSAGIPLELSDQDSERLDALKFSDPDAWRTEMNKLESTHQSGNAKRFDDVIGEAKTKAGAQFELERRINVLKEFNVGRKTEVTPTLLDSEIPPRISNKLAEGKVTFEEYLSEVDTYLSKGKVVEKLDPSSTKDINDVTGTQTPSAAAAEAQNAIDYGQMTF